MSEPHSSPEKTSEPRPPGGSAAETPRSTVQEQLDKVQEQLDEALADSFPASDPVSIVTSHQEDWDQPESQ
jgi:hypothetical protein